MDIEQSNQVLLGDEIIYSIAQVLDEIILETDMLESPLETCFITEKKPSISLHHYLMRIQKYCYCTNECFVLALIYIDRIQELNTDLIINSYCIHRFLLTSILIAIKYNDDDYYKNEYYAKVGGITILEINKLELEFLEMMNYKLYVSTNLYYYYKDRLTKYAQM